MNLALAGHVALYVALLAAVAGAISSFRIARGSVGAATLAVARRSAAIHFLATLAASIVLVAALLAGEFSIAYVANHSNSELAPVFRVSAWWGGQEGSLLLWTLVLAGYVVAVDRAHRDRDARARAATRALLLSLTALFVALIAFVAPVFALASEQPPDGSGLAVALQNYWMAIHPPLLYLGYVGALVPFAIMAGAAFTGELPRECIARTRSWVLVSWGFLTAGLAFGARWAYEEIGWGGYWGWDPVENVALLPWLVLGAMLHSLRLQARGGHLPTWNAVLATAAAALAIFGTFVTRSGLVESVHAFVESPTGWYFLGLLAAVLVAGAAIVSRALRGAAPAAPRIERIGSREGSFLGNSVLLVALMLTVLWGVLQPVVTEAVLGLRTTVSTSYYNAFLAVFGVPLLALIAIGQAQGWRPQPGQLRSRLARPLLIGVAAAVLVEFAAPGIDLLAAVVVALAFLVIASAAGELGGRIRRLRPAVGSTAAATRRAFATSRRRFGAYIAHAGVAVLALGIVGSGLYQQHVEARLLPGETVSAGAYELRYQEPVRRAAGTSMEVSARFSVSRDGRALGTTEAGRVFHTVQGEITNEVGILADAARLTDVMVVVDGLDEAGAAQVQVYRNPMIDLVWASAVLLCLGGLIAGWPARRSSEGTGLAQRGTTDTWTVPTATDSSMPVPTSAPRADATPRV